MHLPVDIGVCKVHLNCVIVSMSDEDEKEAKHELRGDR